MAACRPRTPEPRDEQGSGAGAPPVVEAPGRLLRTERTLVEPQLEEEAVGLAHHRPLWHVQLPHDRLAVEVRADGVERLPGLELRDAPLQVVVRGGEAPHLARV